MPAVHQLLTRPGVAELLRLIASGGAEGRLVGGCVRDALAGRIGGDIDVAINQPITQFWEHCIACGVRVIPTGLAHGTVTVLMRGHAFEVTQLRRDVQTDGRHAHVEAITDWREDAARRDFTINALYLRADGDVEDYFNGQEDLRRGIVRFIGDPVQRIREDYLRILRYYRFALFFGREEDMASAEAACELQAGLEQLSVERIQAELFRIFQAPNPVWMLQRMQHQGIFATLFNTKAQTDVLETVWCDLPDRVGQKELVLWALFPQDEFFFRRYFRLSNAQLKWMKTLWAHRDDALNLASALRVRYAADLTCAHIWIQTTAARLATDSARDEARTIWKKTEEALPEFPLRGGDLLREGWAPGQPIGEALAACQEWWIAKGARGDKAACLHFCQCCKTREKHSKIDQNGAHNDD